jgi:dolichol-phosphate mannosyltransferase
MIITNSVKGYGPRCGFKFINTDVSLFHVISLVVPTYNERANLRELVERISALGILELEIIVVDDDSKDGTGELAETLAESYPVRLVRRGGKFGLSSAIMDGIASSRGDIVGFMDADLQHPPEKIPPMIDALKDSDIVIGSRYSPGGGISDWPFHRRLVSALASAIARPVTRVSDPMSGFMFFKKPVIENIDLDTRGFKIGFEILTKGRYQKIIEIPITFNPRKSGTSKLGFAEYTAYLRQCSSIYYSLLIQAVRRPFKFAVVGGIGTMLNLVVMYTLVEGIGAWYMAASVVAFLVAVSNNYVWNKAWTFRDRKTEKNRVTYPRFLATSLTALILNLSLLHILVRYAEIHYLIAQLTSILGAFTINYLLSNRFVFQKNKF